MTPQKPVSTPAVTLLPEFEATLWEAAGWSTGEAAAWWLQGFSLDQARFVRAHLRRAAPSPEEQPTDEATPREWLASGLPADDIVLAIASGHLTVADAARLTTRMNDDPAVRGTLTLVAALRGVDVQSLANSPC